MEPEARTAKLIIEIPFECNDLDDDAFELFIKEAKQAYGINVDVIRSISEKHPEICRIYSLSVEHFKAKIEFGVE